MKTGSTVKRQSAGKEDPVYKMGKKRMKNEWTEQDLRQFVESSRPVFQDVSLTQVDEDADRCWQDDGLMVDYELRGGQVDCVLRRCVVADGKVWQLQMTAPLAGNDLPEDPAGAGDVPRRHEPRLCDGGVQPPLLRDGILHET